MNDDAQNESAVKRVDGLQLPTTRKLRFDILTIFPDFFRHVFEFGIIRRAQIAGIVEVAAHDLRNWAAGKHRLTDDRPFGGGDGMVMKPEPIFAAVEDLQARRFEDATVKRDAEVNQAVDDSRANNERESRVVLLTPQGKTLTQNVAQQLAEARHIILICGRYEGVDERVAQTIVSDEISIGDYVLSGGEVAAVVVVDAVTRLLEGALGNVSSAANDSFSHGLLDFPHYTRPPEFRGLRVPQVLIDGNHKLIARWRRKQALLKTRRHRPDLLAKAVLSADDEMLLREIEREELNLAE